MAHYDPAEAGFGTIEAHKWSGKRKTVDANGNEVWVDAPMSSKEPWNIEGGISDWSESKVDRARAPQYFDWRTAAARDKYAESRGMSDQAMEYLRQQASGQGPSVVQAQSALDRDKMIQQVAAAQAQAGDNPMAARKGLMATGLVGAQLGAQQSAGIAKEQAVGRGALGGALTGQRGLEQGLYKTEVGAEMGNRQDALAREKLAQDIAKGGLGEKLLGAGYAQDYEKGSTIHDRKGNEIARNMVLGQPEANGVDAMSVLGGVGTSLGILAGIFSDKKTKDLVYSDKACKNALERGDMATYNLLQAQANQQQSGGFSGATAPGMVPQQGFQQRAYQAPGLGQVGMAPQPEDTRYPGPAQAGSQMSPNFGAAAQAPKGPQRLVPTKPSAPAAAFDASAGYGRNRKPAPFMPGIVGSAGSWASDGGSIAGSNAPTGGGSWGMTPPPTGGGSWGMTPPPTGGGSWGTTPTPGGGGSWGVTPQANASWQLGKKEDKTSNGYGDSKFFSDKGTKALIQTSPILGGFFGAQKGYDINEMLYDPTVLGAPATEQRHSAPFATAFDKEYKVGEPYSDNAVDMALAKSGLGPNEKAVIEYPAMSTQAALSEKGTSKRKYSPDPLSFDMMTPAKAARQPLPGQLPDAELPDDLSSLPGTGQVPGDAFMPGDATFDLPDADMPGSLAPNDNKKYFGQAMNILAGMGNLGGTIARIVEDANTMKYPHGRIGSAPVPSLGQSASGGLGKSLVFSDEDTKALIQGPDNSKKIYELLDNLKPVDFVYKDPARHGRGPDDTDDRMGIYADDMEKSELGRKFVDYEPGTGTKMLDLSIDKFGPQLLANETDLHNRIKVLEELLNVKH